MAPYDAGMRIADAARQLVGVRFRPQGRGVDGLDCLGVVVLAVGAVGVRLAVPGNYRLGRHCRGQVLDAVGGSGLVPVAMGPALAGDVLLRFPAMRQVHFGVRTDAGLVEALVTVGHVVERPLVPGEIWDCAWRVPVGTAGC